MKRISLVYLAAALVCVSCATTALRWPDFMGIDDTVFAGRYAEGFARVREEAGKLYQPKDRLVYLLDAGTLAYYAGDYRESARLLQEADRAIEEAFTKSISDGFRAYLSSDAAKRVYEGEDFENIYLNLFTALDYYHLGDLENALVEIRRMNEKLRYMEGEYDRQEQTFLEALKDSVGGRELAGPCRSAFFVVG